MKTRIAEALVGARPRARLPPLTADFGDGIVPSGMLVCGACPPDDPTDGHSAKSDDAPRTRGRGSRSMWAGHVTFGLVSIPVAIHAAVEASHRVAFRQLPSEGHGADPLQEVLQRGGRRGPERRDREGLRGRKGEYAVVEKEELDQVQEELGEGDRTIEIVEFVDFASLNPLLFEKPYYLAPQDGGSRPTASCRRRLRRGEAGRASRASTCAPGRSWRPLLPSRDVLSLDGDARVRRAPRSRRRSTVPHAKTSAAEVKMARSLIESMSDTWDPTAHPNAYRKALEKLVASKRKFVIEEPERGRGRATEGRRSHGGAAEEPR